MRAFYLVMADDIQEALNRLDESLSFLVIPYVVSAITVSTIVDVFPYKPSESLIPEGFKPTGIIRLYPFSKRKSSDPTVISNLKPLIGEENANKLEALKGKEYKTANLSGMVNFDWGGDWYSDSAEIIYHPINVKGGKISINYCFFDLK